MIVQLNLSGELLRRADGRPVEPSDDDAAARDPSLAGPVGRVTHVEYDREAETLRVTVELDEDVVRARLDEPRRAF